MRTATHIFFFFFCLFHFSVYSEALCGKEKRTLIEARKEYILLEKKKKQAELNKVFLDSSIKAVENRVKEIFNEKIKTQNELDEIFYKIDKLKAIKAYVEWKKIEDKPSKFTYGSLEYKKAWDKYEKVYYKWKKVRAGFFKKIFYFLIYPSRTKLFIQSYKKHNKLKSEWKKGVWID